MKALQEVNPEMGGFDELATLLAMPEEHFAILAPVFLAELEKGLKNINDQMLLVQSMNLTGLKAENVREQYEAICAEIDDQMGDIISHQKRDFLKQMLGITYNALAEAEGIAKKNILIPLEFCHTDAKMPAYAHLTDSGMDVYALEDITIAPGETKLVPIGIKVAIPAGYELQVRPKSGRCLKTKLRVANTPGTIDAGYRDEIAVIIDNIEPFIKSADIDENGRLYNVQFGSSHTIGKGEKFAQLVLAEVPKAIFYEVEKVADIANDGRNGGFGSSGLK
jgi:dUTP pyrophosphatase